MGGIGAIIEFVAVGGMPALLKVVGIISLMLLTVYLFLSNRN